MELNFQSVECRYKLRRFYIQLNSKYRSLLGQRETCESTFLLIKDKTTRLPSFWRFACYCISCYMFNQFAIVQANVEI